MYPKNQNEQNESDGAEAQAEAEMQEAERAVEEVEKIVSAFNTRFAVTNDSDSKELSLYQRKLMNDFLRQTLGKSLPNAEIILKNPQENQNWVVDNFDVTFPCIECGKPVTKSEGSSNCHDICRLEL